MMMNCKKPAVTAMVGLHNLANVAISSVLLLFVLSFHQARAADPVTFAVIGDFGDRSQNANNVADMVLGWNPDFILTVGDNYYTAAGGSGLNRYDNSVGDYYCRYLDAAHDGNDCPESGQPTTNLFFPALGNHDYSNAGPNSYTTYTDYFQLGGSSSGNERYYEFIKGPVHFFVINSDTNEPDGTSGTSTQAQWLQTQLGNSTAAWKVVYFHHAAYSSSSTHGSTARMQWPFASWGADVVIGGHDHTYERIFQDGIVYFVSGNGGRGLYSCGTPISGSQTCYDAAHGAMWITASDDAMTFEARSIADGASGGNGGAVVDSYQLPAAASCTTIGPIAVSQGSDDAEESQSNGSMKLGRSKLALGRRIVGSRFRNLAIPAGATIQNASIEFTVDQKTDATQTDLAFYGDDSDSASTFTATTNDISSRTKTSASVAWNNVPAWNTPGDTHVTPNLGAIVQEIIDRPGWSSGNALAFIIDGSGRRRAESYDGDSTRAPKLTVEYCLPNADISGRVWDDANDDGIQDAGETGLAGVTVELFASSGGAAVQSTSTDSNGDYSFANVATGSYYVEVTKPSNFYNFSPKDQGSDDALDSDVDPATGRTNAFSWTTGGTPVDFDAGLVFDASNICYAVADGGDHLVQINKDGTGFQDIGYVGAFPNIEAIAFRPATQTLYAADANRLGTLNLTTGLFTAIGGSVGTGNGSAGSVAFNDVDGLSFDPFTGILWGTQRRSGAKDLLLQIDPTSGTFVADAFGNNVDYLVIDASLNDIDDIAIDPSDGTMYAVNNGGGSADRLVTIDRTTGAVTEIGVLNVTDMEGLSFGPDGTLYGTTGNRSSGSDDNKLWAIDKATATATLRGPFTLYSDYEGSDCLIDAPVQGSISDVVWFDSNGNGVRDPDETTRFSGATVKLYQDSDDDGTPDGPALATVVTDANGRYLFSGLEAGKYLVDVDETTLPAGLTETTFTGNPNGISDTIDLSQGEHFNDAPFGYESDSTRAVLGGTVWSDLDSNGVIDNGETGIGGVDISILDQSTGNIGKTVTSGADGNWLATELPAGNYTVVYDATDIPSGYDSAQPTNMPADDDNYAVTVAAGESRLGLDFGFDETSPGVGAGSISGTFFLDANGNGGQDPGEDGIASVEVNLVDSSGDIVATVSTDNSGNYSFAGVLPGSYTLSYADPNGILDGLTETRALTSAVIPVTAGSSSTGNDAGYKPPVPGVVGDLVWNDIDGNGVIDAGEPGIGNVTLELWVDVNGNGVIDSGDNLYRTATTDASGRYQFEGVPVSGNSYLARVTDANSVLGGMSATSGSDSKTQPYAVSGGGTDNGADFGYSGGANAHSISGTVFDDANNNGTDDSETGVSGVTVKLYRIVNSQRTPYGTTTTDSNGNYSFPGLPDGDYEIEVDPIGSTVDGYSQTTQTGSNGVQAVTLAGSDVIDQDFGFYDNGVVTNPVSLSGFEALPAGGEGQVLFRWTTATETGNIGFHLYMQEAGEWVLVNDAPIPSQAVDSVRTLEYSYRGYGIEATLFAIEDVDIHGVATLHGPYRLGRRYGVIGVAAEQTSQNAATAAAQQRSAGAKRQDSRIDWRTINQEHRMKRDRRMQRKRDEMQQKLEKLRTKKRDSLSRWRGDAPGSAFASARRSTWAERVIGGLAMLLISSVQAAPAPVVDLINLEVKEPGIYRVTYEALQEAGLDLAGIPSKRVTLRSRGKPVPIHVKAGKRLGPGTYIEFIGEPVASLYTDTNVYTLGIGRKNRAKIRRDKRKIPNVPAATYFMKTVTVEPQARYGFAAPNGDPWYAHRLLAWGSPAKLDLDISADGYIENPDPHSDADEPVVSVSLWGGSDLPGDAVRNPDHHVTVELNGTALADVRFDGIKAKEIGGNLSGALRAGNNVMTVKLPFDTGYEFDLANIDRWQMTYPSALTASGDRLTFDASGKRFEVTGMSNGLTADDVVVYRTSGGRTERISRVQVRCAAQCSVTFRGNGRPAAYHVSTVARLKTPAAMIPVGETADITSGEAELLVISHPDFIDRLNDALPTLNPDGLYESVKIVDVEEIYRQFAYAIVDAQAIKAFIAYAHANMKTRHVLLVGGDSYDYKNYLGLDAKSFVPTLYTATDAIVTFAPVDPLYTDVDGDWIPDLAIGRLPVRTEAELITVLAKSEAYEARDYSRTAVFAADGYDRFQGYDFKADAETVIMQFFTDWQVDKAYVDDGAEVAHAALFDAINRGVALTSFFGHSGPTLWTFNSPPLLQSSELAGLTNAGRPTVVAQWGCWNTLFVSPYEQTIGHQFMLNGDQGAAAVLGASTLTGATAERELANELFARLQPGVSVGDAVLEAKQAYAKTHPDQKDVILGWTLLGLPGLRM